MKLNEHTLTVLKNFSSINASIVLQPGKLQRTISADGTIYAEAELDEITEEKCGIYDMQRFLSNISLLNDPELTFGPRTITMDDGNAKLTFAACVPDIIISPEDGKKPRIKDPDYSFILTNATFQKLQKLAQNNKLPHIAIVGKNGEVRIETKDMENDSSVSASSLIDKNYAGPDFYDVLIVGNMRIIPDDYEVVLKHNVCALFNSTTKKINYGIAMQKTKKRNAE